MYYGACFQKRRKELLLDSQSYSIETIGKILDNFFLV